MGFLPRPALTSRVDHTSSPISKQSIPSKSSSSLSLVLHNHTTSSPCIQCQRELEHGVHGHTRNASNSKIRCTERMKREHNHKELRVLACCSSASRFTVDCVAICCCPLSILHLAVLVFIKLPISVASRTVMQLKCLPGMCIRIPSSSAEDVEDIDFKTARTQRSFDAHVSPVEYTTRFDSQKLWQHFGAGEMEFGGLL